MKNVKKVAKYIIALKKYADFPSMFLQLKPDTKSSISRQYSVGPKSTQEKIPVEKATKKPYVEQLLVYTTSVLSEAEQNKAQRELTDLLNEYGKDPEFQRLRGSQAGNELYEKKKAELKAEVDKKYTPKERPVAWGVGTYFQVDNDLFSYHYGRGRRGWSDAPSNRKSLIEYIQKNNGNVYVIAPDPDVAEKRKLRRDQKPVEDEPRQNIKDRAMTYLKQKLPELRSKRDQALEMARQQITKELDAIFEKAKKDDAYSFDVKVGPGAAGNLVNKIMNLIWKANSGYSYVDKPEELKQLVREINSVLT
jgi:hypothetical protein